MDKQKYNSMNDVTLLSRYKQDLPSFWADEKYKWEAVRHFQDNWNIDAPDFGDMIKEATSKHGNLLASYNYFPVGMIMSFASVDVERTRNMFRMLFDEAKDIAQRINAFIIEAEEFRKTRESDWKQHYQDLRAVSVYLTLRYPEKYFIYKYREFVNAVETLGDNSSIFRKKNKNFGQHYASIVQYLNNVCETLTADEELQMEMHSLLDGRTELYKDEARHITTSDYIFYLGRRLKNQMSTSSSNTEEDDDDNDEVAYWTYSPGEQASKWNDCTKEGIMCIGWDPLGDLTHYNNRDEMQREIKRHYPTDGSAKNDSLAVWQFTHDMKPGDIVYAKKGRSTIIGRGVVESDYYYDEDREEFKNVRRVKWTNVGVWDSEDIHAMKTLTNVTKYKDYVEKLESLFDSSKKRTNMPKTKYQEYIDLLEEARNLVLTGAPGTGKTFLAKEIVKAMGAETDFVQFHPSYDYTDFVEGLRPLQKDGGEMGFERKDGIFKEFCKKALKNWEDSQKTPNEIIEEESLEEKYNELLQRIEDGELNKFQLRTGDKVMEVVEISDYNNIILKTPGSESSKTYTVSLNRLTKLAKVYTSLDDLDKIPNIARDIRDVIGGCNASAYWAVLREIYKQRESLRDERSIARPKYIGRAAYIDSPDLAGNFVKEKKYVFIIDEVNRGEISKIFGELFFSIDPGYRGVKGRVKTQYQNLISEDDVFYDGFFVPENVYILATMNDIDRSVESMDFAMRRRFTWKEITPDDTAEMLNTLDCDEEAKATMNRLNAVIAKTEGLGAAYMVGPSYFLKLDENGGDFNKLWKMNIEPLLKEYLRGFRKAGDILGKLKKAYFGNNEESGSSSDLLDED